MKRRSTLNALVVASLFCVARALALVVSFAPLSSFAQGPGTAPALTAAVLDADKLPVVLEGKIDTEGWGTSGAGWRVVVEERRPDGAIRGRMNFQGTTCAANNAPFDGTFDGKNLKLNMPFDKRIPYCRDVVYQLAWNESSRRFEGYQQITASGGNLIALRLTLVPVSK
jgi:hypothetical protein